MLEKEIFAASSKIELIERTLFSDLKRECLSYVTQVQIIGIHIGILDALCSFATVSIDNDYVRPILSDSLVTDIKQGRHPVVEKSIGRVKFVANDTLLTHEGSFFAVLTGPNMGGKSTYLRQVGVIQLMAQIGCFVPAKSAYLGIVDQIFTRIGAGDSLAKGDSTFMVEMKEAAKIVSLATEKSLVLVDELGRGTATNDGFSLALSVSEWLIQNVRSRTIFATHFHELTELESRYAQVACLRVGILETASKIEFTHQIENRAAEKSYGIHVAKLAGLPPAILKRANEIASTLSSEIKVGDCSFDLHLKEEDSKSNETILEFIELVSKIQPDALTPRDSLKILYDIVDQAIKVREGF